MPDRPTELDLLGWIEGDLPTDRRALVERALAADPALRRRLDAMAADRRILRELPPIAAPAGLVRAALDASEREALLGPAPSLRPGVLARLGAPRRVALAAGLLLVIGGGALVVWTGQLNPRATRTDNIATSGAESTPSTDTRPSDAALAMAPMESRRADASEPMRVSRRDASTLTAADDRSAAEIAAAPAIATDMSMPRARAAFAEPASLTAFEPLEPAPDGGIFPLMRAVRAIDDARIDWSVEGERYLTLMVAGMERSVPVQRPRSAPLVTPASYDDALRLAAMNRLTVRICSKNPGAVERALRDFVEGTKNEARMSVIGASGGDMRYAMELDRTVPEFAALVTALQKADPTTQAFLDVSLLPAARTLGVAWNDAPRQVSNRGPRVRVPVVLECVAATE